MAFAKPDKSYVLCGDGVPEKDLSEIASNILAETHCDITLEDISQCHEKADRLALVFGANIGANRLETLFAYPFSGYYELINNHELPKGTFAKRLEKNSVAYSFATRTVCRYPVALYISKNISLKLDLSQDLQEKIELVLHEGLVNSALHGNLEIGHHAKDSFERLDAFDMEIEHKLTNDSLAERRVEVRISWDDEAVKIQVSDQGSGFSFCKDNWDSMPWRGMNLISSLVFSVCAGEEGKPLTMIMKR